LNSRDGAHRQVFFYASYEPEVTALFQTLVRPGMTVLDIGANAGYYSLIASDLGASVHAFEPNPAMAAMIRASASMGESDITVVVAACSDLAGQAELHLSNEGNTAISSLHRCAAGLGDQSITVPTLILDEYVARTGITPHLVKIDAERHELAVVRGAEWVLREARPDLVVEITDVRVLDELLAYDYRAWKITECGLEETTDLAPSGWGNVYLRPLELCY
jgi:FkbM family methyltransferase